MAEAGGDSTLAMLMLADDLILLSDDITALERQLKINEATVKAWESRAELTEPEWWEKVWDSDLTKVVLFCGGVWLGKTMVEVR